MHYLATRVSTSGRPHCLREKFRAGQYIRENASISFLFRLLAYRTSEACIRIKVWQGRMMISHYYEHVSA